MEQSDDSDAKEVLRFCMMYNLSPKDLESVVNNRYWEIASHYKQSLNDKQRDMIKELVDELKKKRDNRQK